MRFLKPETIHEAIEVLRADPNSTTLIAGGNVVVLMLQQKLIAPETLVSLAGVSGLGGVRDDGERIHIGALTVHREIEQSLLIRTRCPALSQACSVVGNIRVRNQGTLGGNLGEADYASDPGAVLLALNAVIITAGPSGERRIPISEFFVGFYTTALEEGEIITGIEIPALPEGTRAAYLKYKSRSSEDRPCVGVTALAAFDGDKCTDLRVGVGAASETPRRLSEVERAAQGQPLTDELIREIAESYAAGIETLDDLRGSAWYRTQMIRVHVRRALEEVRDVHR
jgi:carbon-monoxide dehydrogenase medium subunit